MGAPYYAESFSPMPGRCFRLVKRSDAEGQPMHCPEPVAWQGTFRSLGGARYRVDSCEGHAGPLENRRNLSA
jgi:hypothetical protein